MTVYKIYTERKNLKWLCNEIAEISGGFTVHKTTGFFNGKQEKSVCVEIITSDYTVGYWVNHTLRYKIMGYNKQKSVLITKHEVEVLQ